MNYMGRAGESTVCASFLHLLLGLENEGRGLLSVGDDLPRITVVWNPFPDSALFKVCFFLLKPPTPWHAERGCAKKELVNVQDHPVLSMRVVNYFPSSWLQCHPYVTLQPLDSSRLATIFLPCNRNCLFKTMLERKIFAKITVPPPTTISGVWSLSALPIFSPCTGTRFPCVVPGTSICVWIQMNFFFFSIGSYYVYYLATCCF